MENTTFEEKELRKRFVSDLNLPIQVLHSPYFEDRLELLEKDFKAKTSYNELLSIINERFGGRINDFLTYYYEVRDSIITNILESKAYNDFITNNEYIKKFTPICEKRELYTNEQNGGLFVSFDMKSANFQTLKYANPSIVLYCLSYEDLVGIFTSLDYIKKSKYTRQVIFGKLNPKRTISLEKWITNEFAKEFMNNIMDSDKLALFSINSDEVIFKFNGTENEFEDFALPKSLTWNDVTFKCEMFKLHARHFKLAVSDALLTVYEKEDFMNGRVRHLKGVPATYYPQVYKLLNGLEITPSDLIFYYEHELCQFMNPIKLID